MGARKSRMTRKANALFEHNPNYTFRQLMESYRFWKREKKYLQSKIKQATPTWKDVDVDEFIKEIR